MGECWVTVSTWKDILKKGWLRPYESPAHSPGASSAQATSTCKVCKSSNGCDCRVKQRAGNIDDMWRCTECLARGRNQFNNDSADDCTKCGQSQAKRRRRLLSRFQREL